MANNFENVCLIDNPLVQHNLSIIRNKNTDSVSFRNSIKILSTILSIEAISNLPLKKDNVDTPIEKTEVQVIDNSANVFVVPILRAGLGIAQHLYDLLPFSTIQHLGMYRNEETLEPVWYYNKLPTTFKNVDNTYVYLCDPMLATGGSIAEAVKLYISKCVSQKNIRILSIISAPEGLIKVNKMFPEVKIYTTCIDKGLNEKGYIVPGLGDAGDRIFGTIY